MTKISVGDPILSPPSDNKYTDWHEDDTNRDPTPANKRRTEIYKSTQPKNETKVAFRGKELGIAPGPNKQ